MILVIQCLNLIIQMQSNLNQLIQNNGPPIALIDNWRDEFIGYAIWDFEETLEWNYNGLYLSGKKQKTASLDTVQKILNIWKKDDSNKICAVGYINYNFKDILYPHIKFKRGDKNFPLLFFASQKK